MIKINEEKYWYGFHPHQIEFLKNYDKAFIGFGCGSEELIFLIPFSSLEPLLNNMNITEKKDRMYWHVVISNINEEYFIHQPLLKNNSRVNITEYRI